MFIVIGHGRLSRQVILKVCIPFALARSLPSMASLWRNNAQIWCKNECASLVKFLSAFFQGLLSYGLWGYPILQVIRKHNHLHDLPFYHRQVPLPTGTGCRPPGTRCTRSTGSGYCPRYCGGWGSTQSSTGCWWYWPDPCTGPTTWTGELPEVLLRDWEETVRSDRVVRWIVGNIVTAQERYPLRTDVLICLCRSLSAVHQSSRSDAHNIRRRSSGSSGTDWM